MSKFAFYWPETKLRISESSQLNVTYVAKVTLTSVWIEIEPCVAMHHGLADVAASSASMLDDSKMTTLRWRNGVWPPGWLFKETLRSPCGQPARLALTFHVSLLNYRSELTILTNGYERKVTRVKRLWLSILRFHLIMTCQVSLFMFENMNFQISVPFVSEIQVFGAMMQSAKTTSWNKWHRGRCQDYYIITLDKMT